MKNNFDKSLRNSVPTEEKELILKHARFGRLVTKLFVVVVYYVEIITFLAPLIIGRDSDPARNNRYPLCAWYYWDQNSYLFYVIAYIIQVCTLGYLYF